MRLTMLALLAPLALSVACADATTAPSKQLTPSRSLGGPAKRQGIAIPIGQTVVIAGTTLRITFSAVESDSRCPIEVDCFWAGDASVDLSFSHGTNSSSATLHTTLNPTSTVFDGFTIRLLSLAPDQSEENPIDPTTYVAFVQVTPAN